MGNANIAPAPVDYRVEKCMKNYQSRQFVPTSIQYNRHIYLDYFFYSCSSGRKNSNLMANFHSL